MRRCRRPNRLAAARALCCRAPTIFTAQHISIYTAQQPILTSIVPSVSSCRFPGNFPVCEFSTVSPIRYIKSSPTHIPHCRSCHIELTQPDEWMQNHGFLFHRRRVYVLQLQLHAMESGHSFYWAPESDGVCRPFGVTWIRICPRR